MSQVEDSDIRRDIIKYLKAHPEGAGAVTIANDLWISVYSVITTLQELKFNGLVKKSDENNRWYYAK